MHAFRDPAGHEAPFWIDFFHPGMYCLVNAQMGALMMIRRFLVSAAALATMTGVALAADLPNEKGPPAFAPPPPPAFTWTGLYIGAQVGYEWGNAGGFLETNPGDAFVNSINGLTPSGVVGGGHIGFNYQVSQFVFGLEGDVEGTSNGASALQTTGPGAGSVFYENNEIQGSVRGRAGWAWDRILIYGTGGVAFASVRDISTPVAGLADSETFGQVGWTAGGGIEYAIDPNWLVRIEYRYTDYGSHDFVLLNETGGADAVHVHDTDNRVEVGASYKFDIFAPPAPVVAKY